MHVFPRIYPVFLLCILLPSLSLLAQPSASLSFDHISVEDGLSQGSIIYMMKDSRGFLWFATQDGLNRYDGYQFKTYRHEPGNPNTLSNNYVWTLAEDPAGNIWIGTFGGGLCKLDTKHETFTNFLPDPNDPFYTLPHAGVRSLCIHQDSLLLVGTDNGLAILDLQTEKITSYRKDWSGDHHYPGNNIFVIKVIDGDTILLGVEKGIFLLDLSEVHFQEILLEAEQYETRVAYFTSAIIQVDKHNFWVGTGRGLFNLIRDKVGRFRVVKHIQHDPQRSASLSSNMVNSLFLDKNQHLWIGTAEGLNDIDLADLNTENPEFRHSKDDPLRPASLSHERVNSLYGDGSDILWVGTSEGVSKLSIQSPLFRSIQFESNGGGLCNNTVLGMTEDSSGNLWVGTVSGLTNIRNWKTPDVATTCVHLPTYLSPNTASDYILNVCRDNDDQLWICTRRGGLARMDAAVVATLESDVATTAAFTHYRHDLEDPEGLNANIVCQLFQDKAGRYWVGTALGGLNLLDPATGKTTIYTVDPQDSTSLPHSFVYAILEDSQDRFWVGTAGGGLCKMDRDAGTFQIFSLDENNPQSLSNDMILCLHESKSNDFWIGTANGLCLMKEEGVFQRFFIKDGLPNDVIYGILEDKSGNLWISTNNGISRVTYKDGQISTINFDTSHGLSGSEFNQFAYYQSKDGWMAFGGVLGLNIFHPDSIQLNLSLPATTLTRFSLFNTEVPILAPSQKKKPKSYHLPSAISEVKKVNLPYTENFLSFEFSALEFTRPDKNQYAYQMEGVDKTWVFSGTRRFADYPNMAPGDYVFKVKAANNDGIWNETPVRLEISISPPPWKTWWAYLAYALFAIGAIYAFIRYRTEAIQREMKTKARIERIKVEEREKLRASTSRDFHDEAGNNLTKLSLYTELTKRSAGDNPELLGFLDKIEENLKGLGSGIRDFIWVLDPKHDDLQTTLMRIIDFGNKLYADSEIDFLAQNDLPEGASSPLNLYAKRHLLLIFKEAMNNAMKYAQCKAVSLTIRQVPDQLVLTLTDDGVGFDKASLDRINGLDNMTFRANEIGGELAITSAPGKGTTVQLRLPSPPL